ncbi:MAG: pilus assembly protein TadG-related protein, partial [Candidatus Kariarchaeaceae archaeon]
MRKTNILNKIHCTRYGEHGQIAVLMVFAVVALFGAAALSIDGGLLYFQRRAAQSAADNAAMTGALAIAKGYNSSQIQTIAL